MLSTSETALCEFGCGEKIKEDIIKFADGYSVKTQLDVNSGDYHLCASEEQHKKLDEYNKKHQNDLSIEDLRTKGDFQMFKKRIKEQTQFDYFDCMDGFNNLAYAYWYCAEFDDAIKAAETHLKMYPNMFGLWEIKWESLIHLKLEHKAIKLLEELLNKLLAYKKNPQKKTEYDEEEWDNWEYGHAESVLYGGLEKSYERIKDISKQLEYLEKQIKFLEQNKNKLLEGEKNQDAPSGLFTNELIRVYERYGNALLSIRKNKEASVAFEKANILLEQLGTHKPSERNNDLTKSSIDQIDEFAQTSNIQKSRERKLREGHVFFHVPFADMSEDDMIGTIEIEFRRIIIKKLSKFDDWETERIPPDTLESAKKDKIEAEEDPSLLDSGRRVIDYLDFTDYKRIFEYKGNWPKIFQEVFKDQELFFGNLRNLQKYRNPISHHRGSKLGEYLTDHGHGHLIQLYNYFMHLINQDKYK